jgi:hypothetical protein
MSIIPIEREINKTKRELDDAEWEGRYCEHLKKHLERLIQDKLEGEVYYVEF